MINPLSMFVEKTDAGEQCFSMTRVVAFLFALTVCYAILLYARAPHDMNWPFACVAIVTLLAVPIQMLFRWLHKWAATREGGTILRKIAETAAQNIAPGATSAIVEAVGGRTTVMTGSPGTTQQTVTTTDNTNPPPARGAEG